MYFEVLVVILEKLLSKVDSAQNIPLGSSQDPTHDSRPASDLESRSMLGWLRFRCPLGAAAAMLATQKPSFPDRIHTFRRVSSSGLGCDIAARVMCMSQSFGGELQPNFFDAAKTAAARAGPIEGAQYPLPHHLAGTRRQRHDDSLHFIHPLTPHTGSDRLERPRCPSPLRVLPATRPSGCARRPDRTSQTPPGSGPLPAACPPRTRAVMPTLTRTCGRAWSRFPQRRP